MKAFRHVAAVESAESAFVPSSWALIYLTSVYFPPQSEAIVRARSILGVTGWSADSNPRTSSAQDSAAK